LGRGKIRFGPLGFYFKTFAVTSVRHATVEIKVFTPATRYLANNGMFPEDVEPLVHMLSKLCDSEKRERFLFHFNTGKWPSK